MTTLKMACDHGFVRPLKLALLLMILCQAVRPVLLGRRLLGWLPFTEWGRAFGSEWLK